MPPSTSLRLRTDCRTKPFRTSFLLSDFVLYYGYFQAAAAGANAPLRLRPKNKPAGPLPAVKEVYAMKAHIARNQNAGVPLVLAWNLSAADRGILEGMAPAFGMKLLPVSPADAGKTVAQLLGEVETLAPRTLVLEPDAYPAAVVLANFRERDLDTLLDLMKQAQVQIPLKAVVTPTSRSWVFGDLLAHLAEEHAAYAAAQAAARAPEAQTTV